MFTRTETKQKIISLLPKSKRDNWGYGANHIQDVAEKVLTKKEFNAYLKKSNKDVDACEGMDGQLFNGQYFDWRQFETQGVQILSAFLDYFDDVSLMKILGAM